MGYYQEVVVEYLRVNKFFVNTECPLQLDKGTERKGRHWYCDVMAIGPSIPSVHLCETSYATTLQALTARWFRQL
jgi:hypothetical protein